MSAAGRARDVGQTPNMTAALRQGALWRLRIKVRYVAHDSTEYSANISFLHKDEATYQKIKNFYWYLCEEKDGIKEQPL